MQIAYALLDVFNITGMLMTDGNTVWRKNNKQYTHSHFAGGQGSPKIETRFSLNGKRNGKYELPQISRTSSILDFANPNFIVASYMDNIPSFNNSTLI